MCAKYGSDHATIQNKLQRLREQQAGDDKTLQCYLEEYEEEYLDRSYRMENLRNMIRRRYSHPEHKVEEIARQIEAEEEQALAESNKKWWLLDRHQ